MGSFVKVGIEGTGSYGAGLFRYLHAEHIPVIEVNRPNRQGRHLHGKSDPIDAIAAARAVLAETATAVPKLRGGPVEAIRLLRTTRAMSDSFMGTASAGMRGCPSRSDQGRCRRCCAADPHR